MKWRPQVEQKQVEQKYNTQLWEDTWRELARSRKHIYVAASNATIKGARKELNELKRIDAELVTIMKRIEADASASFQEEIEKFHKNYPNTNELNFISYYS
jgi:septal ring factor EnvC (AmiA/AmiB activator)